MLFSNESKYRIEVNFHGSFRANSRSPNKALSARHRFTLGLLLLPAATVWMWEPWFVTGQVWLQLLLTVLLLILGRRLLQTSPFCGQMVMLLSAAGQCRILSQASRMLYAGNNTNTSETTELLAFPWQVSSHSRLLPGALWLNLTSGNRTQSWWIFRDEVSERDFRRLCLVIRYCQKHPTPKHQ